MLSRASALALLLVFVFGACGSPSSAQATASGTIAGAVTDVSSRGPVKNARVELLQDGAVVKTARSNADGSFSFTAPIATYAIRTTRGGYASTTSAPFPLAAGENVTLAVELQPVTATSLRTIGNVSVNGHSSVSGSTASQTTITSTEFTTRGLNQVQDALDQLPGVTVEHFDNGAPGAVTTLSIRGAGGFVGGSNTGYEVLVLQDGEPLRNGQFGDFDLSALTPSIYQRAELIKGVGGTSIFGANTIGGTLNLVTRDPLKSLGGDLLGGFGGFGLGEYNAMISDTIGKLGFIFDAHQYGTVGYIDPNFRGDFGGDFCSSPTNICDVTGASQLLNVKSALGKVRYDFSSATSLTLSATLESDYRDQLGLLTNPTTGGSDNSAVDPAGFPYFFGFPGDYVWNIEPKVAADFHTQVGGGDLEIRSYRQTLERVVDGNGEPNNANNPICCFESRSVDRLAGDEVLYNRVLGNHSLTIGFGGNGDNFFSGSDSTFSNSATATTPFMPAPAINFKGFAYNAVGTEVERTYLLRDDFQATPKLNLSLASYYSDYDILNVRRFDPRFGVSYRPDNQTAIRFSAGTGFGPPRLSDIVTGLDLSANDSTSAPQCPSGNQFCVASVGNRGLRGESAVGYDFGVERDFLGRGSVTADVYRTNVYGHIFDALVPSTGLTFTGSPSSGGGLPVLFLSEPVNLAGTVYEGVEFSARVPIPSFTQIALDGLYNTQAAYPKGVDPLTESAIQNVVNNEQYLGVPLHKYGYGIDYESRDRRAVAFLNGTFYDRNNAYNLPSFWLWNTGFTIPLGASELHVTDRNLFNKNAFVFSKFDGGVPYAGFGGPFSTTGFPVAPHTVEVTLERRFGAYR